MSFLKHLSKNEANLGVVYHLSYFYLLFKLLPFENTQNYCLFRAFHAHQTHMFIE